MCRPSLYLGVTVHSLSQPCFLHRKKTSGGSGCSAVLYVTVQILRIHRTFFFKHLSVQLKNQNNEMSAPCALFVKWNFDSSYQTKIVFYSIYRTKSRIKRNVCCMGPNMGPYYESNIPKLTLSAILDMTKPNYILRMKTRELFPE